MDPNDEAITLLESMFPGVSRERLRTVLQATNYNVERAVELLLQNPSDQPQPTETNPVDLGPIQAVAAEDPASEFETLEERRDMLLAMQLQRDEELAAERHKAKRHRRKEQAVQQEHRDEDSVEESGESDGEAQRQEEEDLINFGEIADKLNEFGEAAKQKFKLFADKISGLFDGDAPQQPKQPVQPGANQVVPQPSAVTPDTTAGQIELMEDNNHEDDGDAALVDRRVSSRPTEPAAPAPAVANLLGFEPKNES